jgi:hypothetical protein
VILLYNIIELIIVQTIISGNLVSYTWKLGELYNSYHCTSYVGPIHGVIYQYMYIYILNHIYLYKEFLLLEAGDFIIFDLAVGCPWDYGPLTVELQPST